MSTRMCGTKVNSRCYHLESRVALWGRVSHWSGAHGVDLFSVTSKSWDLPICTRRPHVQLLIMRVLLIFKSSLLERYGWFYQLDWPRGCPNLSGKEHLEVINIRISGWGTCPPHVDGHHPVLWSPGKERKVELVLNWLMTWARTLVSSDVSHLGSRTFRTGPASSSVALQFSGLQTTPSACWQETVGFLSL